MLVSMFANLSRYNHRCVCTSALPKTATMKRRTPQGGRTDDADVRISKAMSKILRHSPPPGAMDAQGWVTLPVLLQHLKGPVTEEQVRRVIENNDKKRFVIDDSAQPPRIRAAQGHTVELEDPILDQVTDASTVPCAVHVTSHNSWALIKESGELRRMARTHIHFATLPSHMRSNSWAQVLLRLDLEAALKDGFKFYLSTNRVLLCEGPLPVIYVTQIERSSLPAEWVEAAAQQEKPSRQ